MGILLSGLPRMVKRRLIFSSQNSELTIMSLASASTATLCTLGVVYTQQIQVASASTATLCTNTGKCSLSTLEQFLQNQGDI